MFLNKLFYLANLQLLQDVRKDPLILQSLLANPFLNASL